MSRRGSPFWPAIRYAFQERFRAFLVFNVCEGLLNVLLEDYIYRKSSFQKVLLVVYLNSFSNGAFFHMTLTILDGDAD